MHNRNEAYCGVCKLWIRGLSNHNRGKKHNALYAVILEELRNISEREKLSASTIVDEHDERSKQ